MQVSLDSFSKCTLNTYYVCICAFASLFCYVFSSLLKSLLALRLKLLPNMRLLLLLQSTIISLFTNILLSLQSAHWLRLIFLITCLISCSLQLKQKLLDGRNCIYSEKSLGIFFMYSFIIFRFGKYPGVQ